MAQSNGSKFFLLGALVLMSSAGTSVLAADDVAIAGETKSVSLSEDRAMSDSAKGTKAMNMAQITTNVSNPPVYPDPDGTCEVCWAETDVPTSQTTNADFDMYFEDDGEDFEGDLVLTLTLETASELRYVTIADTKINHQETKSYVVSAGSDWDWGRVTEVNVEAVLP